MQSFFSAGSFFSIEAHCCLVLSCFVSLFGASAVQPVNAHPLLQRDGASESDSRSIGEFRNDLKTFMRLSKDADAQIERNAIFNLCELHREIASDSRFETSQQLQGIRAVIAKRLETFSKATRNERLRNDRKSKGSDQETSASQLSLAEPTESVAGGSSNSFSDEATPPSSGDSEFGEAAYDSTSDSYYSMGEFAGGPNQLFGYVGGRFAPPWDHGEELVDLIVNTLDPNSWRRNGGQASIHYFRPLRVLVIHAPLQSHNDATALMNKLRAAGDVQINLNGGLNGIGN